jgi:hypothetical protein
VTAKRDHVSSRSRVEIARYSASRKQARGVVKAYDSGKGTLQELFGVYVRLVVAAEGLAVIGISH